MMVSVYEETSVRTRLEAWDPLERTARTEDEHRDLMRQILQLPAEIALDLDAGTHGAGGSRPLAGDCVPAGGRARDKRFSSLPRPGLATGRAAGLLRLLDASLEMLDLNFFGQFDNVRGGSFGPGTPTVPLHFHFNRINCAMSTILNVGCYDYLGYLGAAEYEEGRSPSDPLVYTTERIKYPATDLELYAGWSKCLADNVVAATGTDDDDDVPQLPPPAPRRRGRSATATAARAVVVRDA